MSEHKGIQGGQREHSRGNLDGRKNQRSELRVERVWTAESGRPWTQSLSLTSCEVVGQSFCFTEFVAAEN